MVGLAGNIFAQRSRANADLRDNLVSSAIRKGVYLVSTDMERWADKAMYSAVPMRQGDRGVQPIVTLVNATSMPLRSMAAATDMYSGHVTRKPGEVPREVAEAALEDMTRTVLKAGLEFIDFHFLIEGVTRAFTHQLVRQRSAVYIQESMRFAVKEDAAVEVGLPPSLAVLKEDDPRRVVWTDEIERMGETYNRLVSSGVPAEDARGLLPTNITTRVHYKTSLRGLLEHSGLRLCTQAQFEWRLVWAGIIQAINRHESFGTGYGSDCWEFQAIAKLFKPVCYRTGKCEFMASVDRACSIRDRVEAHHQNGEPSTVWVDIQTREWAADPTAARKS
jgi:flavin-dependent thymidylate synthase